MFVAYPSQNGQSVTISPRIGSGHVEPKFTQDVEVEVLDGTSLDNDTYNINAHCTRCRTWPLPSDRRGSIDTSSTAQAMIYAIGENSPFFQTDDQEAIIREHMVFGKFTMDLRAATGDAGVPSNTGAEAGVSHGEDSDRESRLGTIFHGIIMCACFVILFPIGALLIRLPFRLAFLLHLIWQILTVLGVLIGFSLGLHISLNTAAHHPKLNSAHQGLGLTIVALCLIQPALGFLHHRTFKLTASPTLLGKVHKAYLGPVVILLGIVNGALGLDFASNRGKLPAYFAFVLFIAIICGLAQWIFRRRGMRKNALNSTAAANFREGMADGGGDVPLQNYGYGQHGNAGTVPGPPQYVNVMPKNEQQRMS